VAGSKVPRSLIRKLDLGETFPLRVLEGIHEMRDHLDWLEEAALCKARELGASITEIAEVLGLTRQSV
jgi:predicted transcriptional regulator